MAVRKIIFGVIAYLLINSCNARSDEYSFYTRFDELKRISTLFLTKNNVDIDSINNIGSYYGKDSIIKKDNNQWDFYYKGRCGTGCSLQYYMNLTPSNDKIKVRLNILSRYKESNYLSHNSLTKEYVPSFSFKKNYILKRIKVNGIEKSVKISQISLDKKNNIYYNCIFKYNGSNYKGIKIDSIEYILLRENSWMFYNSTTKNLSNLQ